MGEMVYLTGKTDGILKDPNENAKYMRALFTADNPGGQLLRGPRTGVPVLQGLRGLGDGRDHLDGVVPERRPGLPLHLPHHPSPPLRAIGVVRKMQRKARETFRYNFKQLVKIHAFKVPHFYGR